MNYSKLVIIILISIITFIIGFLLGKYSSNNQSKITKSNLNNITTLNVICNTKDNNQLEIKATLEYDNNESRAEYYINRAIKESCEYVFSFYDIEEIISISEEIKALTLEEIFNKLHDKGFVVYNFDYTVEE